MPKPLPGKYRMYSANMSDTEVTKLFELRYGESPAVIRRTPAGTLAGPLAPDEQLKAGERIVTGSNDEN